MGLFIVAGVVIVLLISLFLFVLVDMALMPGKIARQRKHPQADAVSIGGVFGLLTGVLWPFALMWAFYRKPVGAQGVTGTPEQDAELQDRIAALETELTRVKAGKGDSPT